MADSTLPLGSGGGKTPPAVIAPFVRAWQSISPSIVPILAVITALIITIPLMIVTRGEGKLGAGLRVASTAYAALLEGSTGLAINAPLHESDVDLVIQLATYTQINENNLLELSSQAENIVEVGVENLIRFHEVLDRYVGTDALPDEAAADALGERIGTMQEIGLDRLEDNGPLLLALNDLPRGEVVEIAGRYAQFTELDDDQRAELVAFVPEAENYSDDDLLDAMKLVNSYRIVTLVRVSEQAQVLTQLGLDPNDGDADVLREIFELATSVSSGPDRVRQLTETSNLFADAGITDLSRLTNQLRLTGNLYSADILTNNPEQVTYAIPLNGGYELAHATPLLRKDFTDDDLKVIEGIIESALAGSEAVIYPDDWEQTTADNGQITISNERMRITFEPYDEAAVNVIYLDNIPDTLLAAVALPDTSEDVENLVASAISAYYENADAETLTDAGAPETADELIRLMQSDEYTDDQFEVIVQAVKSYEDNLAIEDVASLGIQNHPDLFMTVLGLGNLDAEDAASLNALQRVTVGDTSLTSTAYNVRLGGRDVLFALENQLPVNLAENTIILRPNNRILIHEDVTGQTVAIIYSNSNTPDDTSDDVPETVYLNLGGETLLFFPSSLETTLVRAIPFIIAGLAVALGFKAGLFNIGAEGQLYAGTIVAVWFGFTEPFSSLPGIILIPLIMVAGLIGGGLWGMIPGALKAYTGAHEVINTIMLNFIAIRLVDWLIKSDDPYILRDAAASTPRTPFIVTNAELPRFAGMETWVFFLGGIVTLLFLLWIRRDRIRVDLRAAIAPVVWSVVVVIGGIFLRWISVRDNLHMGIVLMILTVWFVDWFLERTTLGFELRTVGANPNAARYAGMNVRWNMVLAMTLSGALAGLAGIIEITGVKHSMEPAFFAGLGFDSIAVALLARNNPRGMIPAGLLWGGLLAGAGLMQVRADISIDLVKIIQAFIIMFIAADTMIRWLWRIPEPSEEDKAQLTFSKGWGA